jgi:hypothetical protein
MISPVADTPNIEKVQTASGFAHSLDFQKRPVIAGAAMDSGHYLAAVERGGDIRVFKTTACLEGGLNCVELKVPHGNDEPLLTLSKQSHASPNSIRLRRIFVDEDEDEDAAQGFQILAIDGEGNIVVRTYA